MNKRFKPEVQNVTSTAVIERGQACGVVEQPAAWGYLEKQCAMNGSSCSQRRLTESICRWSATSFSTRVQPEIFV